ncbi:D-2-hydroxyacid dehydrogenase [Moraxella oblonga]|uniref:D-2-hydroxyacid dehydrogenase n=1 Tax=Moraxella oblonga TaxID=200413 RepID=UPI00082EE44C|nr:D-2-hydroxyacid dehydrogenase [Moraxella oblonga]
MKAVFLDKGTFSAKVDLYAPHGVSDYVVYDSTPNDPAIIIERAKEADIIITNKVILDAKVIKSLPKLKLIQLTATGKNNVDEMACAKHGVVLFNVEGYSVDSVPEHTFMMMLTAMRAGIYYHAQATNGNWQKDGKFCLLDVPILDLAGRTLGVVGRGVIGQKVGQIAQAFGMTVLYAERAGQFPRDESYTAFDEVLARSDILSLHCPLTPQTHHLINDENIAKMAKKPLIVNVARGGIVDSGAVVRGLDGGQILGYATDVFEKEPFADDELLIQIKNHPRTFFTPHNAWGSHQAQTRLWGILCRQVEKFIQSQ